MQHEIIECVVGVLYHATDLLQNNCTSHTLTIATDSFVIELVRILTGKCWFVTVLHAECPIVMYADVQGTRKYHLTI